MNFPHCLFSSVFFQITYTVSFLLPRREGGKAWDAMKYLAQNLYSFLKTFLQHYHILKSTHFPHFTQTWECY